MALLTTTASSINTNTTTAAESLAGRWLRRYKTFFFFGFLILILQLVLAYLLPIFGTTDDIVVAHSGQFNLKHSAPLNIEDDASNSNVDVQDYPAAVGSKTKSTGKHKNHRIHQLRAEEFDFIPACMVVTKEAISAVHRAKSQLCKEQIINTTCAIQAGTFYADRLPNFCPNKNFIAMRSLGCYRDEKKFRILAGYYTNFKVLNTPAKCIQMCLQSGFLYAGVQYSTECFCGNTEPPVTAKLPDPECNYKCIGDPKQICGGYFTINVYETGISKFEPQVAELVPKHGERRVKIAFLLTLNGRATRQVHRLLKALYSQHHYFYIHVDARQDYMYRELLKLEAATSNIRLARKRFSTIWGGASLLKMLLASMVDLLASDWQWDFVINLSESDFLIKTTDKLVDFLSANKDRNFVKSHGREVQRFIQKQGLDKTFVECDTHMWRIGDRQLPDGIQIDGGSDWIALSRDFVKYVTDDEPDELIRGLLTIFHHTLLPAESFFHTALRNSQFCNTYVDNNLHMTNWKRRMGCKCQYKHVVDWCGCSPNDFKPDDWPRLQATEVKQLFFARKFEPIVNQAIILKLEQWLFGPYSGEFSNLHQYWQSIYNADDTSPSPDSALLSVATSLARINSAQTGFSLDKSFRVAEVNTYMEHDMYKGFLVRYRTTEAEQYELLARPQQMSQASRMSSIGKRIKHLEISSDYDQKEHLARNFGKILGPTSEPVAVLHLIGATDEGSVNVTVLWINAIGYLADASTMTIENAATTAASPATVSISFVTAKMSRPLIAGIWTVKIVHKRTVIAQCKFLVCPDDNVIAETKDNDNDQHLLLAPISSIVAAATTTGGDNNLWKTYLPTKQERDNLELSAKENWKLIGNDRKMWIDSLVRQLYTIESVCAIVRRTTNVTDEKDVMPLCKDTNWSSLAYDPKSDIYSDIQNLLV